MNLVISMGRLTADPKITMAGDGSLMIARYSLALDRRVRRDAPEGTRTADFPNYVVFGKGAEFAEKYLRKGMKVLVNGHLQTGSYQGEDGRTVYKTEVVVESQEFADSRRPEDGQGSAASASAPAPAPAPQQTAPRQSAPAQARPTQAQAEAWMNIPPGAEDNLPFE